MVETGTKLLDVDRLQFGYDRELILREIDISIDRGEVFCLLGPNGCGKTTLLDCILGIHKPGSGRILLQNKDLALMSNIDAARLMSYVPQIHEKNFSFSVLDVILMGRTAFTGFFGAPGNQDRVKAEKLLREMNFYHMKDRDYTKLSGGESQMVMIMRALVQEAALIIMDEPASHLDFRNELFLLETIISIVEKGLRSVLMSTHSPNQAFFLENRGVPVRVGMMHEGKLHKVGTPTQVLSPENIEQIYGVKAEVVTAADDSSKGQGFYSLVPIRTVGGFGSAG